MGVVSGLGVKARCLWSQAIVGDLEIAGRMRYSSNATFLVEATLDGTTVPAVYKPQRGERPLWDFPEGTLCRREVAAYELSVGLDWGIVPVTVLRTEGGLSVQGLLVAARRPA